MRDVIGLIMLLVRPIRGHGVRHRVNINAVVSFIPPVEKHISSYFLSSENRTRGNAVYGRSFLDDMPTKARPRPFSPVLL